MQAMRFVQTCLAITFVPIVVTTAGLAWYQLSYPEFWTLRVATSAKLFFGLNLILSGAVLFFARRTDIQPAWAAIAVLVIAICDISFIAAELFRGLGQF
jgi:hypothetical protein